MSKISDNFFLIVEGLDGSGKTVIARRLAQVLQATHKDKVKLTFEPHDPSCSGLFIRQVLMKRLKNISARTLALAFAANRADHCDREIVEYLSTGEQRIVICDRYYLSSLVYQSSPDLSLDEVMAFNAGAQPPDLTIFLNASNRTCYERMRRRPEDKQLFEKNVSHTRENYKNAIEFLRGRGETIIEVDANPSIQEVLKDIVTILTDYGPGWLRIQRPLSLATLPRVYSLESFDRIDLKVKDVARDLAKHWKLISIGSEADLLESILALEEEVDTVIDEMSFDDLGSLFLDCIRQSGYKIIDKLPWTDLAAFELEYGMPLQTVQRGTALLLGEAQRYDLVMKKVLTLDRLSDFMFILDATPSHLINRHYERDLVLHSKDSVSLSPSTRVISRADIAKLVLAANLYLYLDHNYLTVSGLGRKQVFFNVVKDLKLDWQWHRPSL